MEKKIPSFDIKQVVFDESYKNSDYGEETLFFIAPKDWLGGLYPEAIHSEIAVKYDLAHPEAESALVQMSPTKEDETGDAEDYDWFVVDLPLAEIEALMALAKKEKGKKKTTKFKEIPQYTGNGRYRVNYMWRHLKEYIEREVRESGLKLNPNFQRGHVWSVDQQIAYIEHILRGGKSGKDIYLNKPDWHTSVPEGAYNEYVCVDGLQRLTAIQCFLEDVIPAFGSYYSEYSDKLPMDAEVILHVNDLKTRREVLQWYLEMNAGGTPHSNAEIERIKKLLDKEPSA